MGYASTSSKSLTPYFVLSGICLAIFGGIKLHIAIVSSTLSGGVSSVEVMIGTITYYAGFALLIVPLILIGTVYTGRKSETGSAVFLLILFIGADLFIAYMPGYDTWLGGWGGLIVLVLYGIIRGISFVRVNRALDIPKPGYKNKLLAIFGWSFLITTIISFGLLFGGLYSYNPGLYNAGIYTLIAQMYIEALTLGIAGIMFLTDAFNKGRLEVPGVRPTQTQPTQQTTIYTPSTTTSAPTYTPTTSTQTEGSVIKYCTYCGAQNYSDGKYCENCGQKLD